jgi:hypothetical protein
MEYKVSQCLANTTTKDQERKWIVQRAKERKKDMVKERIGSE